MTSGYDAGTMQKRVLADYGFARARDLAFDAVRGLWTRRRAQGMTQANLAEKLGRDPAWVSRALKGPGNWTLRTFGELVAAMDGDVEMIAYALEDSLSEAPNYSAYAEYDACPPSTTRRLGSVLEKSSRDWQNQEERKEGLRIDISQIGPTGSIMSERKLWNS